MSTAAAAPKAKKAAKPKAPASHPTYKVMTSAAIAALKEQKGSSRQGIIKYVVANYKLQATDPKKVNTHVKAALVRGLKEGIFKNSKGIKVNTFLRNKSHWTLLLYLFRQGCNWFLQIVWKAQSSKKTKGKENDDEEGCRRQTQEAKESQKEGCSQTQGRQVTCKEGCRQEAKGSEEARRWKETQSTQIPSKEGSCCQETQSRKEEPSCKEN